MTNNQIAETFEQIADLLEFQGANAFRIRAYRNGARSVRDLADPIAGLMQDPEVDLTKLPGIGKDLAAKCRELVEHGTIAMLEELLREIPVSVLSLLRIPGLGPKKAAVLHRELGIDNLEQLAEACQSGTVRKLKGFGAKTEEQILKGMAIAEAAGQRIYWARADEIAQRLRSFLSSCEAVRQLELAGSYRRGKETVGDLDVLVDSSNVNEVMDRFQQFEDVADVIQRGDTKMSVRLRSGLQVDLRVVPTASFGAALQYFTGSKEHNVLVRGRAKELGLRVNEYGVYRAGENGEAVGPSIAGSTEEDVYRAIKLPWIAPELREARKELQWAEQGELPTLITAEDLIGDLHMHTTATDGAASIEEMIAAARQRGLRYVAITDHSRRVTMANGLDPKRLRSQWQQIDKLRASIPDDFVVLKGIECDILEDGTMDLPDDVLEEADWVIASVHYGQNQSRERITERIVSALENPHVDVIAHPTGRLINRREPYQVDLEAVMRVAKQHGKILELNANPARLDLNDVHCAAAKAMGIPIVISSDAHSVEGLDVLRYGVLQARRAGLTRHDVANTRGWPELKKIMGHPHAKQQ
ncbi:MAG: DNA polymerase/3'-5' exonuclease PolX [Planctomycetales bacterium]|nr:DNA polymerase/3'-5' exonuclease PolX [Planctomycetales bacterium]